MRTGQVDRFQWWAADNLEEEDELSFFVTYSREGFVEGTVQVPEEDRPRFKFSYDVPNHWSRHNVNF